MKRYMERRREQGFTLIELLIAIVVVGVLAAVAIVGINGLVNKGGTSACTATKDAVRQAEAVHHANTGSYTTDATAMTTASPSELDLDSGVAVATTNVANDTLHGTSGGWNVIIKVTSGQLDLTTSSC